MTSDDYAALLRQALSSPHGVALDFDDWVMAERARGRLYRLRSALRRAGDTSFDDLSLVVRPCGGLWIVRRDKLPRHNMEDGLPMESRPIEQDELPDHFGYCNNSFTVRNRK